MPERERLMDQPATKIQRYIWNSHAEQMPRTELAALQVQRLQQQVTRVVNRRQLVQSLEQKA